MKLHQLLLATALTATLFTACSNKFEDKCLEESKGKEDAKEVCACMGDAYSDLSSELQDAVLTDKEPEKVTDDMKKEMNVFINSTMKCAMQASKK